MQGDHLRVTNPDLMIMVKGTMMVTGGGASEAIIMIKGRTGGMIMMEYVMIYMMNTYIMVALMRLQS